VEAYASVSGSAISVSIIAFCRERLASYKVPIRLAFRTAAQLPRTPTGKIHKPSLSRELTASDRPVSTCVRVWADDRPGVSRI
jgi:acyl-CoA synthetase (AMP-forming)/AMP-acid ligase II